MPFFFAFVSFIFVAIDDIILGNADTVVVLVMLCKEMVNGQTLHLV